MSVRSAVASRWSQLLEVAERRLPALTRLKQAETLPILLHRHRIYVLPTRFGAMFSVIILVMLLGALNYNNNPALLLTCLLAAASYQSVFQAYRSVDRIELHSLRAEPCHAGDPLQLGIHFHTDARNRQGICLSIEDRQAVFDLVAGGSISVPIELPTARRGWQSIGRIRLWSEYPIGLFHVWSWLHPDFAALIYPRLEPFAPPLPRGDGKSEDTALRRSGDEFAMLRDYHPTDPRRTIAWKASARHDTLLVKEFEQRRGREITLDWNATATLDYDARISRLARWVCDAETAQVSYVLRIPGQQLGPGLGADHRHTCLRALALLPESGA